MGSRAIIVESSTLDHDFFDGTIDDIIIKLQVLKDGIINSRGEEVIIRNIRIRNDYHAGYMCYIERYETDAEYNKRIDDALQKEILTNERDAVLLRLAEIDRQLAEIGLSNSNGAQ